ncbi:hypothetical protein [Candidatus Rariloculus sp.]|uniref:hypothetical protein n=1 Tax=Candidatus Rariloculus sp. TaxID=3101265 RepID=UPI003D0C4FFA
MTLVIVRDSSGNQVGAFDASEFKTVHPAGTDAEDGYVIALRDDRLFFANLDLDDLLGQLGDEI